MTYAVATGIAAVAWTAWGGLDALGDGDVLTVAWALGLATCVWFVVAGIGLRLVRAAERRSFVGRSLD